MNSTTEGQEVKFHEIKIGGQIMLQSWDQQNFGFFMRSKFLINIWSPDRGIFQEIKIQKSIISKLQSHEQFNSYKYNHEIKIC
jgi:hypothetical protein